MKRAACLLTILSLLAIQLSAGEPTPFDNLQRQLDAALEQGDDLLLKPGVYTIREPLVSGVTIRGRGDCRLVWAGPETDKPMLTLQGQAGTIHWPSISGVEFRGNGKAPGLLVADVHRATVEDLHFFQVKGFGLRTERSWNLHLRNLAVVYANDTRAYVLDSMSGGSANGLLAEHVKGAGPMLAVSGTAPITAITIEECDSGDQPLVLLKQLWSAEASEFHFENNRCSAAIQLEDAKCAKVSGVKIWQRMTGEARAQFGVRLVKSIDCEVERVWAWNVPRAIVSLDAESYEHGCQAWRGIREPYGESLGIQPGAIIEVTGRTMP